MSKSVMSRFFSLSLSTTTSMQIYGDLPHLVSTLWPCFFWGSITPQSEFQIPLSLWKLSGHSCLRYIKSKYLKLPHCNRLLRRDVAVGACPLTQTLRRLIQPIRANLQSVCRNKFAGSFFDTCTLYCVFQSLYLCSGHKVISLPKKKRKQINNCIPMRGKIFMKLACTLCGLIHKFVLTSSPFAI